MLLLDVDRFKTVNDSLGHQVGDALLVEMAGRIEAVSRADSTVARLGGDEFVVLVEGLPSADAVHAVAAPAARDVAAPVRPRPRRRLAGRHGEHRRLGAPPTPARTPGDLYREADLALYRAKDSGRDQYALFDDELRARADRRLAAETLLRRALAENLLVPVFQPIVDLTTGGCTPPRRWPASTTATARRARRLHRRRRGDRPDRRARRADVRAGRRRVRAGCSTRACLLRRLTTNVSARSLEDPGFVGRTAARRCGGTACRGSMIRVELTERSLLAASPMVSESLRRIQDLGLEVGLDDFGTGYSALAYLQSFPLQFLKIDRSFVSRLGTSARDDAVVAAVIDLAHAHDLVVVGEGVETHEQLAALRRMGCDRAQGYLMGRPMSAAALDDLLRSDPPGSRQRGSSSPPG